MPQRKSLADRIHVAWRLNLWHRDSLVIAGAGISGTLFTVYSISVITPGTLQVVYLMSSTTV